MGSAQERGAAGSCLKIVAPADVWLDCDGSRHTFAGSDLQVAVKPDRDARTANH